MINSLQHSVNHPNAYSWPQEDISHLLPADPEYVDLRKQVDTLKQRVESLCQTVQYLLQDTAWSDLR